MYDDDMMYDKDMGPEVEEPGEAMEAGMGYGHGSMHNMPEHMGMEMDDDEGYEDEGYEDGMAVPAGVRMDLIMRADDDSDEESPLGYEVYGYNSDDDDDEPTCCIVQSHGGGEQTMVIIPMALLKMMHSECCRWEESCGYGSH
ncbi:MAG: hypothetical protein ACOYOQ_15565 [Microthrixaceae bacterium]